MAGNNGIVTVGALTGAGSAASFSNFGACIDITLDPPPRSRPP